MKRANDLSRSVDSKAELAKFFEWVTTTHLRYALPGCTGLDMGRSAASFDQGAAHLEGTARLLWGGAFALSGGVAPASMDALIDGLANGADPEHPGYWEAVVDHDQRAVEMAPIAAVLLENPSVADRLGKGGAENLYRWLSGIQSVYLTPNNWRFFRILVQKALLAAGRPVDEALLADELEFIDAQYRGGGWYGDTARACRDYYTAFAFHYYSLLYARWFRKTEPERCEVYIARARDFALRYRWWFDDDGAQIAYGRSLTYRFASACFWPLMAEFGHPELSTGILRGLWARNLAWWLRDSGRVFDDEGRFTIGYGYPNLLMMDFYNSPQSPLWALKSLFPLALGESDPFWQAAPEACPYDSDRFADRDGGFVMARQGGGAYMLAGAPQGFELRGTVDKYMKFAYSSRHGFGVESTALIPSGMYGDNFLAFGRDNRWFIRESIQDSVITDGTLTTRWSPLPGCTVETRQEFTGDGELRQHIIELPESMEFIATGHAADQFARAGGPSPEHGAVALGETLFSGIEDADRRYRAGVAPQTPNSNLMFPQAAVPYISGRLPAGRTFLRTVLRYGKKKEGIS